MIIVHQNGAKFLSFFNVYNFHGMMMRSKMEQSKSIVVEGRKANYSWSFIQVIENSFYSKSIYALILGILFFAHQNILIKNVFFVHFSLGFILIVHLEFFIVVCSFLFRFFDA
jgi:hypothetical protein